MDSKKNKKAVKRRYEKPAMLKTVVFERASLACVPTNLNTDPNPPFPGIPGCSMQS